MVVVSLTVATEMEEDTQVACASFSTELVRQGIATGSRSLCAA